MRSPRFLASVVAGLALLGASVWPSATAEAAPAPRAAHASAVVLPGEYRAARRAADTAEQICEYEGWASRPCDFAFAVVAAAAPYGWHVDADADAGRITIRPNLDR